MMMFCCISEKDSFSKRFISNNSMVVDSAEKKKTTFEAKFVAAKYLSTQ